MPQNTVSSMYFDNSTGFLWMTTEAGIVRYNGIETTVFDKRELPGMKTVRMKSFYRSLKEGVFAADKEGHLYAIENAAINELERGKEPDFYMPDLFTGNFADLRQAKDIVFHNEQLLSAEEKRSGVFDLVRVPYSVLNIDSKTWVSYSSGYILVFRGKQRIAVHPNFSKEPLVLVNDGSNVFAINRNGEYYFIDPKSLEIEKRNCDDPAFKKGKAVIFYDKMNNQPLVLNGNKLYKIQFAGKNIQTCLVADLHNLPRNISSIIIHPDGRKIFIGSHLNGLTIYSKSIFETYSAKGDVHIEGSRYEDRSNMYAAVLADSNHVLTSTSVLFNLADKTYSFLPFSVERTQSMLFDENKNIWYGTGDTIYNIRYGSYKKNKALSIDVPSTDTRIKNFLQCFYQAANGRVWISTYDFFGYVQGDSIIKTCRFRRGGNNFLSHITQSSSGALYGSNALGLYSVDSTGTRIVQIQEVTAKDIRYIYFDRLDHCWIATYGNGIYMYDLRENKFYSLPVDPKGYLLFSHSFSEDGKGNFLIPTNKGLFRINISHLVATTKNPKLHLIYQYFDVSTGLESNEFNGGCEPAFTRLPQGDLLFPSLSGLVRVRINELPEPINYPLFVYCIETRGKIYKIRNCDSAMFNFNATERLQTWCINVAQWSQTGNSGISYKLDNNDWAYLQEGVNKIQLSNLEGGKHTLLIRSQTGFPGETITPLAFNFYIAKKIYERSWFWLLSIIASVIIIYQAAALRNIQLRRKNLQLERKIHSKTMEVKLKNTDLEETLANLSIAMKHLEQNGKFQRKLIAILGHDIMIPLQYISKVSKQIINYREKLSVDSTIEAVDDIGHTASQLLYLGESIIQWIKIQEGYFIPNYQSFKAYDVVENMFRLHKHMAQEKRNRMINDVPVELHCVQEPLIIKIILHNLLLNANKFTTHGTITVAIKSTTRYFQLIVTDNGMGMEEDIAASLNNMIAVRPMRGTEKEIGWGLGYMLIIDLVKFVHGKLFVESKRGEGTTVTISFNPDHLNPK